ncbi:hypothetical protein RJ639_035310 [Escallonia herrerae]|uniref:Uncharacterized protein n=1 Tax=Escallonia herrerae TaxID=1293975 RepID=A0AA89B6R1_9ASTE|nr:hypothetical protein RJ639_035310 [Escallonia herrerae]
MFSDSICKVIGYSYLQEDGWPLGLQPLNLRAGLLRNPDMSNGSVSFNTLVTGSPTSSTDSSSDLDTESTGSFFHDKSITLGSLIGVSSILELSRRSMRGTSSEPLKGKRSSKPKAWLFSLCSKLSTDAVSMNSTPSLRHFLEAERRAASMYRRNQSPRMCSDANSLFVGSRVAPPDSRCWLEPDNECGAPLLLAYGKLNYHIPSGITCEGSSTSQTSVMVSVSFNTSVTGSPTSSTDSSSDLDTESITLGSLIGVSSILELSRRSMRGTASEPLKGKRGSKPKAWLLSPCSKLSTDAVSMNNIPSLRRFLEAERRAASIYRRNQSPGTCAADYFLHIKPVSDANSLFVGSRVAPPNSRCSLEPDNEYGAPLLFA